MRRGLNPHLLSTWRIVMFVCGLSQERVVSQVTGPDPIAIYPLFGQEAGGTHVTIEANISSEIRVYLISPSVATKRLVASGPPIGQDQLRLVLQTISFFMPPKVNDMTVIIEVDTGNSTFTRSFQYRANPFVNAIRQDTTLISGGFDLIIVGSSLSSAVNYRLHLNTTVPIMPSPCEWNPGADLIDCIIPDLRRNILLVNPPSSDPLIGRIPAYLDGDGAIVKGADNFLISVFRDPIIFNLTEPFIVKAGEPQELILGGKMLNLVAKPQDFQISIGNTERCQSVRLSPESLACQLPPFNPLQPQPSNVIVVHMKSLKFVPGFVVYQYGAKNDTVLESTTVTTGNNGTTNGHTTPIPEPVLILSIMVPIIIAITATAVGLIGLRRRLRLKRKREKLAASLLSMAHTNHSYIRTEDVLETQLNPDLRIKLEKIRIPEELLTVTKNSLLGKGFFGCIYTGQLRVMDGRTLRTVAVKTLKDTQDADLDLVESFLEEATLLMDCDHPNILITTGVVWPKGDRPKVVMPYMSRGDLRSLVQKDDPHFTNGDILHFCMQIAAGMEYLSDHRFVHRDLAARNCLVDDLFLVKIADFGLSRDVYDKDYYREERPNKPKPIKWMALESLREGVYNSSTDVWAFGVTVWELCTRGGNPYPGIENRELVEYLESGKRLYQPAHMHNVIYECLLKCWQPKGENRPSFNGLHSFLKEALEGTSLHLDQQQETPYSYVRCLTKHIPENYKSTDATYADSRAVYINRGKHGGSIHQMAVESEDTNADFTAIKESQVVNALGNDQDNDKQEEIVELY